MEPTGTIASPRGRLMDSQAEDRGALPNGLYCLVSIEKEQQNMQAVAKPVAQPAEYQRLLRHLGAQGSHVALSPAATDASSSDCCPGRLDLRLLNRLRISPTLLRGTRSDLTPHLASSCGMPAAVLAAVEVIEPMSLLLWAPQLLDASSHTATATQQHDGSAGASVSSSSSSSSASAGDLLTAAGEVYLILWAPSAEYARASPLSPYCSLLRYAHDLAPREVVVVPPAAVSGLAAGFVPNRLLEKQPDSAHRTTLRLVSCTAQETDVMIHSDAVAQEWSAATITALAGLQSPVAAAGSASSAASADAAVSSSICLDVRTNGATLMVQHEEPESVGESSFAHRVPLPTGLAAKLQGLENDGFEVRLAASLLQAVEDYWLNPRQQLRQQQRRNSQATHSPVAASATSASSASVLHDTQLHPAVVLQRHALPKCFDRLNAARVHYQQEQRKQEQVLAGVAADVMRSENEELLRLEQDCERMLKLWALDLPGGTAAGEQCRTANGGGGGAGAAGGSAAPQVHDGWPRINQGRSDRGAELRRLQLLLGNAQDSSMCCVCREDFQEGTEHPQRPLGLPCASGIHVFCACCLAKLVEGAGDRDTIKCPTCQHSHDVSQALSWSYSVTTLAMVAQARELEAQCHGLENLQQEEREQQERAGQEQQALEKRWDLAGCHHFTRESIEQRVPQVLQLYAEATVLFRDYKHLLTSKQRALPQRDFVAWICGEGMADLEAAVAKAAPPSRTSVGRQLQAAAGAALSALFAGSSGRKAWLDIAKAGTRWLQQLQGKELLRTAQREARSFIAAAAVRDTVSAHRQQLQLGRPARVLQARASITSSNQQPLVAYAETVRKELQALAAAGLRCSPGNTSTADTVVAASSSSGGGVVGPGRSDQQQDQLVCTITHVRYYPAALEWDPDHLCSRDRPAELELEVRQQTRVPGWRRHSLVALLPQEARLAASCGSGAAGGSVPLEPCKHLEFRLSSGWELILTQPLPGGHTLIVITTAAASTSGAGPGGSTSSSPPQLYDECCGGGPTTEVYISSRHSGQALERRNQRLMLRPRVAEALFDDATRVLVLHAQDQQEISVYVFDDAYEICRKRHCFNYGDSLPGGVAAMRMVPKRKLLLLATPEGMLYLYDIINASFKPTCTYPLPQLPIAGSDGSSSSASVQLHVTPEGAMALVVYQLPAAAPAAGDSGAVSIGSGGGGRWVYDVLCLEDHPRHPLLGTIKRAQPLLPLLPTSQAAPSFRTCSIRNQPYLVILSDGQLKAWPLHITVHAQRQTLSIVPDEGSTTRPPAVTGGVARGSATADVPAANALLEFIRHTYEKFPFTSSLGDAPACREVWLYGGGDGDAGSLTAAAAAAAPVAPATPAAALDAMKQYGKELWADVRRTTKKVFNGAELEFKVATISSDLPSASASARDGQPPNLLCAAQVYGATIFSGASGQRGRTFMWYMGCWGDWLLRAMCLVPLQLCRCEGNNMYPLSDGRPLQQGSDEASDIHAVAQTVSMGLYDTVLSTLSHLPVYVISSMGSQSVGKSYQLNHLGGCYFDVSGGRCTDGCWLSCRPWTTLEGAKVLLVFLDFEGIGSWERTETEDMLMSLLSAALSDLTLFKTHFAWDRYNEQTLRRFNMGAPKVLAMCGTRRGHVFRGALVLCLKDCQSSNEAEAHGEFKYKLEEMVKDPKNFLGDLYNSDVTLFSFPFLKKRDFYHRLKEILIMGNIVDKTLAKRAAAASGAQSLNAMQFASLVPMLLVKLAHKDWTPVDRDQIRARVEVLRDALPRVCARGSLAPDGRPPDSGPLQSDQLVDMESQAVVPDIESLRVTLWELPDWRLQPAASIGVEVMPIAVKPGEAGDGAMEQQQPQEGPGVEGAEMLAANIKLSDEGLELLCIDVAGNYGDVRLLVNALRSRYQELFSAAPVTGDQHRVHHHNLGVFIAEVVERRHARSRDWLVCNMKHFLEDPEAYGLLQEHSSAKARVAQRLTLCSHACCSACFLPCYLPAGHTDPHNCNTGDHTCAAECQYCSHTAQEDREKGKSGAAVERCTQPAGHPGQHNCGSASHTCRAECHLFSCSRNCRQLCTLMPGHEGEHMCDSGNHLCAASCDLEGCPHQCIVPYGQPHTVHQCAMQGCPVQCMLCHQRCSHASHFHARRMGATHLCGSAHTCGEPQTCKAKPCCAAGVCEIRSELQRETRTFNGAHGAFDYTYRTRQTTRRHNCGKEIPPGRLVHDGPCLHSADAVHFCGHPCPSCGYMCTKAYGHAGRHATQHGNMEDAHFVAQETEDVDVGSRRYRVGEQGIAETCDSFCASQGRGHVHVLPCDPSRCDRDGPSIMVGRRHARATYNGGDAIRRDAPLDELTHDAYYEAIDFECPCNEEQRGQFKLCGASCGSAAHNDSADSPVPVCSESLWHAPVRRGALPESLVGKPGHITQNGHFFPCTHDGEYGRFATTLILDTSGSMKTTSAKPTDPMLRNHPDFSGLDNLLGVVYEASHNYMAMRRTRSADDTVTVVTFDASARSAFQDEALGQGPDTPVRLLRSMMAFAKPGRGTDISSGLALAYEYLQSSRQQQQEAGGCGGLDGRKPICVLMTDSDDCKTAATLAKLRDIMAAEGRLPPQQQLVLHVLGFGHDYSWTRLTSKLNEPYLIQLAEIGKGSHYVCRDQTTMAAVQLVSAFGLIAERPDRRGALLPRGVQR